MELAVNVDEVLEACSKREKRELYRALMADEDCVGEKERMMIERQEKIRRETGLMEELEAMTPFELKKTLCNLLRVPSYTDENALRQALESIIQV